jgi:hypothetical protein
MRQAQAAIRTQPANTGFFQKSILILGVLAGLCLFGYALVNLIRMPAVSPDAFVPKGLAGSGKSLFGLLQLIFVLGFSFSFLPVTIMFTIKRYGDNPYGMILGCSLLCFALAIEVVNNLPFIGNYAYPEPLTQIPPDVLLYLNQMSAIRYLCFDVAGFTILYVSLLIFAVIYWNSIRIMSYLIVASITSFAASVPFLWIGGNIAVALMAVSIFCLVPIPMYFGRMAVE